MPTEARAEGKAHERAMGGGPDGAPRVRKVTLYRALPCRNPALRAAGKFKAAGDIETKEFFFCLDAKSSSDAATWLQKLKKKIQPL